MEGGTDISPGLLPVLLLGPLSLLVLLTPLGEHLSARITLLSARRLLGLLAARRLLALLALLTLWQELAGLGVARSLFGEFVHALAELLGVAPVLGALFGAAALLARGPGLLAARLLLLRRDGPLLLGLLTHLLGLGLLFHLLGLGLLLERRLTGGLLLRLWLLEGRLGLGLSAHLLGLGLLLTQLLCLGLLTQLLCLGLLAQLLLGPLLTLLAHLLCRLLGLLLAHLLGLLLTHLSRRLLVRLLVLSLSSALILLIHGFTRSHGMRVALDHAPCACAGHGSPRQSYRPAVRPVASE
ncbi:hypothetical protein [Halosimplex sp. TS25]|uniref:hypothetical protein n=1 Tax=Halosimplex rarum TaxID=3396619 RepID=UPI0039ECB281